MSDDITLMSRDELYQEVLNRPIIAYRWKSLETNTATPFWIDRLTFAESDGSGPKEGEFIKDVVPLVVA